MDFTLEVQKNSLRGKVFQHMKENTGVWFTPGKDGIGARGWLVYGNLLLGLGVHWQETRNNCVHTWHAFYSLSHRRVIWLLWKWIEQDLSEVRPEHYNA